MNSTITSQGPVMSSSLKAREEMAWLELDKCKWQKNLNQLSFPWNEKFPREVVVHNTKLHSTRTYVHLTKNDPRNDQDGWDGEQMVYKTHTKTNNAEYLVLYHTS